MNTIKASFPKSKAKGDGLLIGYITAGDPTPEADAENRRCTHQRWRRHPRVGAAVF